MSKLFLFAIGGTGARVVRSLTMMLASGIKGLDSNTEIVPIIMDYDLSNGDKTRAISALETYSKIHDCLYGGNNNDRTYSDHFFMTKIESLRNVKVENKANNEALRDFEFNYGLGQNDNKKFSEWLGLTEMRNARDLDLTIDLLHALYDSSDEKSPDAELNLNMTKGFKGNPNIGAVVYHGLRKTEEFKRFEAVFDTNNDKVFIISSIFGGTGSSGFPEIVKAIRVSERVKNAVVGSDIVLTYFGLQEPNKNDENEKNTGAIDANSFNGKSRAALAYYASNNGINKKVNGIYYIADNRKFQNLYEYHEGADNQRNNAHIVEFIAAAAIIDFMLGSRDQQNNTHKAYEFAIKQSGEKEPIKLTDFYDRTHDIVLNDLSAFAIAMKYYRDAVCGDKKDVKLSDDTAFLKRFGLRSSDNADFYRDLDVFLGKSDEGEDWGFYTWLDELYNQKHKLKLYNMKEEEDLKNILTYKQKLSNFNRSPLRYSKMTESINKETLNEKNGTAFRFLEALRKVAKEKYESEK